MAANQKMLIDAMGAMDSTRSSMALMDAMRVLKAQNTNASDVAKALEFDPSLSQSIVKEVNSPYFGIKFKVDRLEQAIALLGFNRIIDLLKKSVSHELYEQAQSSYYEMMGFRKHGLGVACIAEQLAVAHRLDNTNEFFQAGMMHDIGKYLYLTKFSDHFKKLSAEMKSTGTPMYILERKLMGVDHTELGEMMADAWGIPDNIRVAIRFHHEFSEKERNRLTTRETQIVDIVSYANKLSHGSKLGGRMQGAVEALPTPPGVLSEADVTDALKVAETQYKEVVKQMGLEN